MLLNVTTSILNLTLDMLSNIFCFFVCINDYCVVNLLPIIYSYYLLCLCSVLFGLLCVVVLALSFCHTLYTHICIFHCDEKPNAWTVAGSSSLDQKTLITFPFFWFSLLNILHI